MIVLSAADTGSIGDHVTAEADIVVDPERVNLVVNI